MEALEQRHGCLAFRTIKRHIAVFHEFAAKVEDEILEHPVVAAQFVVHAIDIVAEGIDRTCQFDEAVPVVWYVVGVSAGPTNQIGIHVNNRRRRGRRKRNLATVNLPERHPVLGKTQGGQISALEQGPQINGQVTQNKLIDQVVTVEVDVRLLPRKALTDDRLDTLIVARRGGVELDLDVRIGRHEVLGDGLVPCFMASPRVQDLHRGLCKSRAGSKCDTGRQRQ